MKNIGKVALCAAVVISMVGCGKKDGGTVGEAPEVRKAEEEPQVATHLGFAARVPGDADVFVAGYQADEFFRQAVRTVMEGMPEEDEPTAEKQEEFERKLEKYSGRLGGEQFLFVGGGAGRQLGQMVTTYRDFSAALTGYMAGGMLDTVREGKLSLEDPDLKGWFPEEMMDGWLDAILKDEHLVVPSIVMGWHPDVAEEAECLKLCREFAAMFFQDVEEAETVEFEAYGGTFAGHVLKGDVVFREMLEKTKTAMEEHAGRVEELAAIGDERLARLRMAMEKLEFTVASGVVDGRVLLYVGNGKGGLRLAEKPEDSLAAADKLGWTSAMVDHPQHAVMYISEPMVESVLPLMDGSALWKRLAEAVRAPIRDERTVRQLLEQMAEHSGRLARREAKAFSMVFLKDDGYRLEARGGWLDPGLDYDSPLRMEAAVTAGNPVFRAHWVGSRARREAEWEQMELAGILIETLARDVMDRYAEGDGELSPTMAGQVLRLFQEVREFCRAYRHEFRAGLGDEVAVMADVRGEIPPVPGIAAETIRDFTMPRMLVAVPMVDRSLVEKSGQSLHKQWRGLTAWAGEAAGMNVPVIAPQLIESGGVSTWYPPAPFIGGDFIPGVSMNDRFWMVSSSRAMVADFARAQVGTSTTGETGVVAVLDVPPLRDWLVELYRRGEMDAGEMLDESIEGFEPSPRSLEDLGDWFKKMEAIRYRHWKEEGAARWSVHVKMAEKDERQD